jgi:GTP-binding protein
MPRRISTAEFLLSAVRPEHFPPPDETEIAFLGRSNVGKSTLLNTLAGIKGLAFSSSTPGRTRSVNFYRVEAGLRFVDLPGYGYARVPREEAESWRATIDAYLSERPVLALALLLVDARRAWMEPDLLLKSWLEHHRRPYLVVATKVDKLNQRERSESRKAFLRETPEESLVWFSAVTGQGVKEIWQAITKSKTR